MKRPGNNNYNNMIKKVFTFLLVLISAQTFARVGTNSDYWILSQNEYNARVSKGKDVTLRRYIVIPDLDKKYKDILETTDEKALLAKFSFMLKRNKSALIEKYILSGDNSLDIHHLINGLYYISKNQYSRAIDHLEKFWNEEYAFLKSLLIADCKYELLRDKKNYQLIIDEYQIAMDNADNEQKKSIINNRIKYIKYR